MFINYFAALPLHYFAVVVATILIVRILYRYYFHPLAHFPGPRLARVTNLHRLYYAWRRQTHREHLALHARYGPVVRIGPNALSVSDPEALTTIYAHNSGFNKSKFYEVQQTISRGRPLLTLFTSTDATFHTRLRRAVSNAYSMSTLVQFEPYIDSTTHKFLRQIERKLQGQRHMEIDMDAWLQWYAFDVIGELTFSKRLGFLDREEDIEGIIQSIQDMLDYASVVGQMPWLDKILVKNPVRLILSKMGLLNSSTFMVRFAQGRIRERVDSKTGAFKDPEQLDDYVRNDFLSRFIQAHHKDPEFISFDRVLALTVANIFAGSDTTAITLRAICYFICKYPRVMQALVSELDEAAICGTFARTDGLVDWHEAQHLPYLDAVVKESLRCHPAAGLTLERITPAQGATVSGYYIPGGTIIGCSAWVLHHDEATFGDMPHEFVPERWLKAGRKERKEMEKALFTFGAGARTCIGRNISLLEIYKFIPALLSAYELSLPSEAWEWKLHNAWFVRQEDCVIRLRRRQPQGDSPRTSNSKFTN